MQSETYLNIAFWKTPSPDFGMCGGWFEQTIVEPKKKSNSSTTSKWNKNKQVANEWMALSNYRRMEIGVFWCCVVRENCQTTKLVEIVLWECVCTCVCMSRANDIVIDGKILDDGRNYGRPKMCIQFLWVCNTVVVVVFAQYSALVFEIFYQ